MKVEEDILARLAVNDPTLIRLDITASLLQTLQKHSQLDDFFRILPQVSSIQSVHLSGIDLDTILTPSQIQNELVVGIASLSHMNDLCIFRGGSTLLTEDVVATLLQHNNNNNNSRRHIHGSSSTTTSSPLKTLLLFQFASFHQSTALVSALRQHTSLQRLTLTFPNGIPYGALDMYAMCFAAMPHLTVLQIRCQPNGGGTATIPTNKKKTNMRHPSRQEESIMSTDAFRILISSTTITSLYMENCGLQDDHMDILEDILCNHNQTLQLLDIKDNHSLSDDVLYSMGRVLSRNHTLTSLDLSGAYISTGGGYALAKGMAQNCTVTHLELEGTEERYQNEFDVQLQHDQEDWMKQIYYHLRLNRARVAAGWNDAQGGGSSSTKRAWVECLNRVSDHLDCSYYFIRQNSQYINRMGRNTICAYHPESQFWNSNQEDNVQQQEEELQRQQRIEANPGTQMIMSYLGQ